ncbi:hypothetical protein HPG69_003525 [Diceros bicornis minor]|uniref:Uncharacterized protein n=1 Tax=Diceros bicornis minor TaxID=77932 RepID=A0A7J7EGY0_DICBM|nr:hypothetical protein HPG69_003525 [Diceros bicornis minor]
MPSKGPLQLVQVFECKKIATALRNAKLTKTKMLDVYYLSSYSYTAPNTLPVCQQLYRETTGAVGKCQASGPFRGRAGVRGGQRSGKGRGRGRPGGRAAVAGREGAGPAPRRGSGRDVPTRAGEGVSGPGPRCSLRACAEAEERLLQPSAPLWSTEGRGLFRYSRLLRDSSSGPSVKWEAPEMGAERYLASRRGKSIRSVTNSNTPLANAPARLPPP